MFDRKTTSEKISATLSKLVDDVDTAAGNDYRRYTSRLAPGDTIEPMDGTIRTDEGRAECSRIIAAAKERVREICDQARDEALAEMAEAPSPAATAFIAGLEARDKVSSDELVAGIRAYGDNWTAYNAMMALVNVSKVRNTPAAIRRLARNSSYILPLLEEDEVITLMEDFVATALTLSIMTDGPQGLAIDVDRAAWFFRQPLVRIKASLLCNGNADAAGLALASLAMWLEDDAATALLKASCAQEEVDEDLLKHLSRLSFIMGDDEDDENDDEVLVTDDLTLRTSSSGRDATLWLFTSPVLVDRMLTLQITRESVEAGFDAGLDVETMEAHLKTPSPLVNDRLRMWRGRYDEFRFTRGICLETSERNARIIAQLPLLKIHIIAQLSPSAFLMKASSEEQWRRILVYSGFDMLPHTIEDDDSQETAGDGVKEREQETVIGCGSIGSLPQETCPGDLSYRTDLEDAIEERIDAQDRQAYMDMLEAGYILSKEQIVPGRHLPKLRSASGFDHQARLGLLNAALGDHSMLALTTADGTMKAFVTLVEKCGRSRNVTVVDENGDEHVIPVERIFRVREILS